MTRKRARLVLRYLAWAGAATAALLLVGYGPTRNLAGPGAVWAMLAGCGIALVAGIAGAVPVVFGERPQGSEGPARALAAMALRLVVVVVLTLSAALSGWFELKPLLIWVAIAYLAQLAVETRFALKSLHTDSER
jgi:hypothetical protein